MLDEFYSLRCPSHSTAALPYSVKALIHQAIKYVRRFLRMNVIKCSGGL